MLNKCAKLRFNKHQNGQIQLGHSLPLFIAIIISTFGHLYLLNQPLLDYLSIFKKAEQNKTVVIQAKLVKSALAKPVAESKPIASHKPIIKPASKPRVKPEKTVVKKLPKKTSKRPAPQPKVIALPTIAPVTNRLTLPPLTDVPVAEESVENNTVSPESVAQTAPPKPTIETAETAKITFEEDIVLVPYRNIESHYDVFVDPDSNTQRSAAGEAVMTYAADGDRYQLKSVIKPHGLIALFIPDLVQTSDGLISDAGLQPEAYLHQFGTKKSKTRKAVFNWAENKLRMQTANAEQMADIAPGAQDLLSFMYQFMFVPPLDKMQMTVTNGRKVSTYQYSFEGEAMVNTKVGLIKTVHILRSDDNQEDQTELWLAVDYRYLPVKIKKTETKKNKIYELVVRSIRTDQGQLTASETQAGDDSQPDAPVVDQDDEARAPSKQTPTQLNPFLNR